MTAARARSWATRRWSRARTACASCATRPRSPSKKSARPDATDPRRRIATRGLAHNTTMGFTLVRRPASTARPPRTHRLFFAGLLGRLLGHLVHARRGRHVAQLLRDLVDGGELAQQAALAGLAALERGHHGERLVLG